MSEASPLAPVPREAARLISCVLPDDGTDRALMRALRDERAIFLGAVDEIPLRQGEKR